MYTRGSTKESVDGASLSDVRLYNTIEEYGTTSAPAPVPEPTSIALLACVMFGKGETGDSHLFRDRRCAGDGGWGRAGRVRKAIMR